MKYLIAVTFLLTSCEHMCLNYFDCDTQVKELKSQIAQLKHENSKLRVFAVEIGSERCDIR